MWWCRWKNAKGGPLGGKEGEGRRGSGCSPVVVTRQYRRRCCRSERRSCCSVGSGCSPAVVARRYRPTGRWCCRLVRAAAASVSAAAQAVAASASAAVPGAVKVVVEEEDVVASASAATKDDEEGPPLPGPPLPDPHAEGGPAIATARCSDSRLSVGSQRRGQTCARRF